MLFFFIHASIANLLDSFRLLFLFVFLRILFLSYIDVGMLVFIYYLFLSSNYKLLVPSLHMDSVTLIHVEYILRTTCSVHMHFNCIYSHIWKMKRAQTPKKRRGAKQKTCKASFMIKKKTKLKISKWDGVLLIQFYLQKDRDKHIIFLV